MKMACDNNNILPVKGKYSKQVYSFKICKQKFLSGFKGFSPLSIAPEFDLINGFAIDSLHSDFLGITKQATFFWFDSSNHKSDFYIGKEVGKIDRNIQQLKVPSRVPSNFKRNPRSITERKNWKANEWRQFLLYTRVGIL